MSFQFAWAGPGETTFGPEHEREDEEVFAFTLEHTEGDFATLSIDIRNPRRQYLAEGANLWMWLSEDGAPLFFGRLVAVPEDLHAEVVRLSFIARPTGFDATKRALAETLRVAPWWDPVWIVDERLDDPDTVLEARSQLWHIDRVSHAVSVSDINVGEDGTLDRVIAECIRCLTAPDISPGTRHVAGQLLPAFVRKRAGLPETPETPVAAGGDFWAAWRTRCQRRSAEAAKVAAAFHDDLKTRTTFASEPGNPRFVALGGRRAWRSFLAESALGSLVVLTAATLHLDVAIAGGMLMALLLVVILRRMATRYDFFCHTVRRTFGLWPLTRDEIVYLRDCRIEPSSRMTSVLLALVNTDSFILCLPDGRTWTVIGLARRRWTRMLAGALDTQRIADLNCMPHSRLLR